MWITFGFIIRSFLGAIGTMLATLVLGAFGISAPTLATAAQTTLGLSVPGYYVAIAQVVALLGAAFLLAWTFARQLNLERPWTPALRRMIAKPKISFEEIAERLAEVHPEYSTDEIIHRLMKAYWRGEFEKGDGTGLVFHEGNEGIRSLDGGGFVHLKGPHDQPDRNADPDPGKIAYGRRIMAFRDGAALARFYPSIFTLQTAFNDTEYSWAALRRQVDWRIFEMIPPSQYSPDYKTIWVGKLMMPRRLFVRWYRRFRRYRYEA